MALKHLAQLQGLLSRCQCALRDFEFAVECTKLEIGRRYISDQRRNYRSLPPLGCQQLGASGFGLPAILSPEVQIPDHREIQFAAIDLVSGKEVRNFGVLLTEN